MCGIYGFNREDKTLLQSMNHILIHRGPDGDGSYIDKNISLGHRRLSIIDLSDNGKQPMSNEDGTVWITFNGEIYNFKELRNILERKGHTFISNTDTEVLVHGYEEWKDKLVEKINGQFAFAIWDSNTKKLFLARDRLGIKPLYYYWDGTKFIFASEIKAILCDVSIKREVDTNAAQEYCNFRYVSGEATLFKNIRKVLPGHGLTLQGNNLFMRKFWDLPLPSSERYLGVTTKVEELFTDSVRKRLVADVPVGVYLSGGIDSASIVALAAEMKKEPIKTFSIGFNSNDKIDELSKARVIADHFKTDHTEIVVDESVKEMLPNIIWNFDMPHGDPVIIPQFLLSKNASQNVKVVLSGEGADEIFGGYVQYKTLLQAQKFKKIPSVITQNAARISPIKLLDQFFDYPESIGTKGKEKLFDFFHDLKDDATAYQDLISIMSKKDQKFLFNKNTSNVNNQEYFQPQRKPLLNRMLYYDTKTWLPNYVLYINDRMTMAHSIEGRVPFLDHKLVEYANRLHPEFKINGKINKYILRQVMAKRLPQSITEGKKHAFFMPLDKWYKEELKGMAEELFTPASVKERGFFKYDYVKKIWNNYNSSKLIYGKQLFTLINFELWHRMFIDAEEVPQKDMKLSSIL